MGNFFESVTVQTSAEEPLPEHDGVYGWQSSTNKMRIDIHTLPKIQTLLHGRIPPSDAAKPK